MWAQAEGPVFACHIRYRVSLNPTAASQRHFLSGCGETRCGEVTASISSSGFETEAWGPAAAHDGDTESGEGGSSGPLPPGAEGTGILFAGPGEGGDQAWRRGGPRGIWGERTHSATDPSLDPTHGRETHISHHVLGMKLTPRPRCVPVGEGAADTWLVAFEL